MRRALVTSLTVLAVAVTATAPASAAASAKSDRRIARAGLLARSDFPTGWKQGARTTTSDAALDAKARNIVSCKAFTAFSTANRSRTHASSPDFKQGQSSVTNAVSVYPSDAKAIAVMGTFKDPLLPTCLERLFTTVFRGEVAKKKSLANQVSSINADIKPLDGVRIGDEAVAYQGTVDVGLKGGSTQTIGLGVMTVRTGRALDGYSWTSDRDISTSLQPAIVASVGRLQQAESGT